jgi:hypothetical protein
VVVNAGTASAAVLNFTIPQGVAGNGGSSGAISSASIYHAVSDVYIYYSLSNSTATASEAVPAPVLTWVPNACTATALNVFSQQTNTITVTLRAGPFGNLINTTLACTATSGTACSTTGNVVIPAGSFVDLSVSGANGSPAAVWTALTCN